MWRSRGESEDQAVLEARFTTRIIQTATGIGVAQEAARYSYSSFKGQLDVEV